MQDRIKSMIRFFLQITALQREVLDIKEQTRKEKENMVRWMFTYIVVSVVQAVNNLNSF